jgi:peptidoglycan hydrolase-like protein with peptidoglycan-binding domain
MSRPPVLAALPALVAATVIACSGGGSGSPSLSTPSSENVAPTLPTTTSTSTTIPSNLLQIGTSGPKVLALQQRLTALGYRPGPVNGTYTADTESAVLAFQKHEGLERDGVAGPVVQAAVSTAHGAGPHAGLPTPRVEVDIARQIAFVVFAGHPVITLNVSTGSDMHYQDPTTKADDVAYTPVGTFAVQRMVNGDVKAPLGVLHRPMYFYGGWALHGAASVPGWPASHGCVRVSYSDADWLYPQVTVGLPVIVYDTTGKSPAVAKAPTGAAPGS